MVLEEQIIKLVLDGNKDEFRKIVEQYHSYVFAICFNLLKDKQEAENMTQETFIKVYSSLNQYKFSGFKTWIGRIATNNCIDLKRKNSLREKNNVVYIEDMKNLFLEEHSIEENLVRKEEIKEVLNFCDKIPEKYSVVIKKYYFDSKSYKEISVEENIAIKTVESRLYRAKKLLLKNLKEDC